MHALTAIRSRLTMCTLALLLANASQAGCGAEREFALIPLKITAGGGVLDGLVRIRVLIRDRPEIAVRMYEAHGDPPFKIGYYIAVPGSVTVVACALASGDRVLGHGEVRARAMPGETSETLTLEINEGESSDCTSPALPGGTGGGGGRSGGGGGGGGGAGGIGGAIAPACPASVPDNATTIATFDDGKPRPSNRCAPEGRSCHAPVRNRLEAQPAELSCDGNITGGKACPIYREVEGCGGRVLELALEVPADTRSSYVQYSEPLGPDTPPEYDLLHTSATHLTFWILNDDAVDLVVSLTTNGPTAMGTIGQAVHVRDYVSGDKPCDKSGPWSKACIPIAVLAQTSDDPGAICADPFRAWSFDFRLSNAPTQSADVRGTVSLDNLALEAIGTAQRLDCIPAPPRGRILLANYDRSVPGVAAERCVRGLFPGLMCEEPRSNLLEQCADMNWCDGAAEEDDRGGGVCVSYETRQEHVLGASGQSLRLDFNVSSAATSETGSFSGYSEKLVSTGERCDAAEPFDLTKDDLDRGYLTFWFKRSSDAIDFEVSLKSSNGVDSVRRATGKRPRLSEFLESTCGRWKDWTKLCIPVAELIPSAGTTDVDPQRIWEINLGFSSIRGLPKEGTAWIDDIAFEPL